VKGFGSDFLKIKGKRERIVASRALEKPRLTPLRLCGGWGWERCVGFLDSHGEVSSWVYTGQQQRAEFVGCLLDGGFAAMDVCLKLTALSF